MSREKQRGKTAKLSLPRYLWTLVKHTSHAERLCCVVSLLLVATCIGLIVSFTTTKQVDQEPDCPPHEWRISRENWLAEPSAAEPTKLNKSAPLVIVNHSAGSPCYQYSTCVAEIRNMQAYFIHKLEGYIDLPYNFIVGNDGRVYDGRGWGAVGTHLAGFNSCSLGLGFLGDYREELAAHAVASAAQMNRTQMLLEEGVRLGYLHKDYMILGAKDLHPNNESPGSSLYNAIKKLPHYDHDKKAFGLNCDQVFALVHGTDNI